MGEEKESLANCAELAARIHNNDPSGREDLCAIFADGIRFLLSRELGPHDLNARVCAAIDAVVDGIRRSELPNPEDLLRFVRTVVRRHIAAHTVSACEDSESTATMSRVLGSVSSRDREILVRFYLRGQSAEQICAEMSVSDADVALTRSRARARFSQSPEKRPPQSSLGALELGAAAGYQK